MACPIFNNNCVVTEKAIIICNALTRPYLGDGTGTLHRPGNLFFGIMCSLFPKSRPILNPEARRDLGNLLLQVASPAIAVASIGSKIHLDDLIELWDLFFWCILSCTLGLLTSVFFSRIFFPSLSCDPLFEGAFTMAATFGNTGTLPIIILDVLCENRILAKRMGSATDCAADARAYVMIYNVSWCILIFGLYIPVFKRIKKQGKAFEKKKSTQNRMVDVPATANVSTHPLVPTTLSLNVNEVASADQNRNHLREPNSFNTEEVNPVRNAVTNLENSCSDDPKIITDLSINVSSSHTAESPKAVNSITKLLPDGTHAPLPSDFFEPPEVDSGASNKSKRHNNMHGSVYPSPSSRRQVIDGPNPSSERYSLSHHLTDSRVNSSNYNQNLEIEGMTEVRSKAPPKSFLKSFVTSFLKPPILASFIGLTIGLVEPLSSSLFPPSTSELSFGFGLLAALGKAILLVGNMGITLGAMVMAASLTFEPPREITKSTMNDAATGDRDIMESRVTSEDENSGSTSTITTAALCLIRLAIVPAVGFTLMWAIMLNKTSPFQGDRGGLRALIILIMFTVPSGQTVLSVMATMQLHLLGKRLAKAYIVMYLASALTMSLWTGLALSLVESHVWSSLDESNVENTTLTQ